MNDVKYPQVKVQLTGKDGNAFAILGRVSKALKAAGVSHQEAQAYCAEATSGNYDNLLATTLKWVDVS
jgi:hypothetical protein